MQKFLRILAFMALMCVPWASQAQTTVEIGDGTSAGYYTPIGTYYTYSITEQLYTADEIGMAGTISSVSFYWNFTTAKTFNITVYMQHVDAADLSTGISLADADVVYEGQISLPAEAGWVTIDLGTPFAYDGSSNLLIGVNKTGGDGWFSGSTWRYTTATNMARYTQNDNSVYNTSTTPGTVTSNRPNIQIQITPGGGGGPVCDKPATFEVSNITSSSATLTWAATTAEDYVLEYKKASETEWTIIDLQSTSMTLNGLTPGTAYSARVKAVCPEVESGYKNVSFTTSYGIPFNESFGTAIPTDWTMYTGLLNDDGTATRAAATYGWNFGTGNNVFDNHARVNIYGNYQRWLVIPALTMEDNVQLTFDLALTVYTSGSNASPTAGGQADDRFAVLVSTDGGDIWEILRVWDNAGSEYVYDEISNAATGEAVAIDLSDYAGQSVIIAFYGESTVSNGDNNLHIDNVSIDYIPDCAKPTGLAKSDVTAHTAVLNWTAGGNESLWQLCINNDESNLIDVDATTYTLTGLTAETPYSVKVRANCGGAFSEWSNAVSFTTAVACPAVTASNITISDIAGHNVTISWTAAEGDAFQYALTPTAAYDAQNIPFSTSMTDHELSWDNLTPQTGYTFALRKDCGDEDGYSSVTTKTFTTTVACPVPTVSVSNITTTTAMVNCTNTAATSFNVMLGDAVVAEGVGMPCQLIDLEANTSYTVKVQAICGGEDGESAYSGGTTFQTAEICPDGMVCIGTGTSTNNNLPTYTYYNYSLTQQIYTAEEIGMAGDISSVDIYKTGTNGGARSLDIYMVSTDKETFEDGYDWVTVTAADKVFSGELTFANNDWTTIEFNDVFSYDGTSNIVLVVDDNTGSYVSAPSFYVFNATSQALRVYSDGTNYDALAPSSYSGTVQNVKNRVRFAISEPADCARPTGVQASCTGTTATVTWNADNSGEVAYTLYYGVVGATEMTEVNNATSPYEITGLEFATTYNVQLQAVCGPTATSDMTNPVSFTTAACAADNMCAITITMTDAYGDGGGQIQVLNSDDEVLGTYTNSSDESTYTLNVCDGAELSFVFAATDSWAYENGYLITDINDEVIAEHEGCASSSACSAPTDGVIATYTVSCAITNCKTPTELAASEIGPHSAQLSWTENGEATAWVVAYAFAGEFIEVDATTNPFVLEGLDPETTYVAKVRPVCEDEAIKWSSEIQFTTTVACPAPTALTVTPTPTSAEVAWNGLAESYTLQYAVNEPLPGSVVSDPVELYYDNGTYGTGIGLNGGTFSWGVMFPAGSYEGNHVSAVSVYDYMAMTGTLSIYNDGETEPSGLVGSQDIEFTGVGDFIEFTTNYQIDPSKNLWVIFYNASGATYPAAASTDDADDPNGRWVELSGAWYDLADAGVSGYCYMIHAFVDDFDADNYDWTTVEDVTSPATINNLTAETEYFVRVKGDCGNEGESNWTMTSFTTPSSCETPVDLVATDVTTTTATLGWSDYQDNYNVRYRTAETENALFFEGFENGLDGWTIVDADDDGNNWLPLSEIMDVYSYYTQIPEWAHSGSNAAISPSYANGVGSMESDHWLISPQLDLQGTLKFYTTSTYEDPDQYEVLLSTTDNDVESFTVTLQELGDATYNEWDEVSIDLSDYEGQQGYIAIHHNSSDKYFLVVDDFGIYAEPTPAGEWVNLTTDENSLDLEDLESATTYEFQVQGICNADVNTEWSAVATFTTLPSCVTPESIDVVEISENSAIIIVEAGEYGEPNGYEVEYWAQGATDHLTVTAEEGQIELTDLDAGTQYIFKVRAICGDDDFSDWSANGQFFTLCNTYDLPYTTEFETSDASLNCWTLEQMYDNNQIVINNGRLKFSSYNTSNDYNQYAISPVFNYNGNNQLVVEMSYATYGSSDQLWLGYTTEEDAEIDDYTFLNADGNGYTTTGENDIAEVSVIIPANAKRVAIHYYGDYSYYAWVDNITVREMEYYTVNVVVDEEQGSVETDPESLEDLPEQTEVSLSAEANFGYEFAGWADEAGDIISEDNPYEFVVTENTDLTAVFEYIDFSVEAVVLPDANDAVHGTVSVSPATAHVGETITVSAVPAEGYDFAGWYNEVVVNDEPSYELVSNDAQYGIEVSEEVGFNSDHIATIYAAFEEIEYTVTLAVNPEAQATIGGPLNIYYNDEDVQYTLQNLAACYEFAGWSVNGFALEGNADGNLVLQGNQLDQYLLGESRNIAIVANLTLKTFDATALVAEGQSSRGTVSGSAQGADCGETVNFVATANPGHTFAGWTNAAGETVGTTSTLAVTVTSDITLYANFTVNQYMITAVANDPEMGSVSGGGNYDYGTTINLVATAETGYTFVNWKVGSEIVGTNATLNNRTVTGAVTYTAYFEPETYAYNEAELGGDGDEPIVITDENGNEVGPNNPFVYGRDYTYSTEVASCYDFVKWVIDGAEYTTNPTTVTCTGAPVASYYTQIKTYNVYAEGNDFGTASVTPASTNEDGSYDCGTQVTLVAEPIDNYNFAGWYDDMELINESASWTFTVGEDVNVQAVFEPETYAYNEAELGGDGDAPVVVTDENGNEVGPNNPFVYGQNYTYSTEVASCYDFVKWVIDGAEYTTNPTTVTCTGAPVASYYTQIKTYSVNATAAANGSVNVTPAATNVDGSYDCGAQVSLVATPATGYHFIGWYNGNDVLSQNATWNTTVGADITAEARFEINTYTVTVVYDATLGTVSYSEGDIASGASFDVDYNTVLAFEASYLPGNRFSNWSDGTNHVTTEAISYSVANYLPTLANNSTVTLTATFADAGSAVVSATANNSAWGHFTGTGTFGVDESFTVTAIAETGYEFLNWDDEVDVPATGNTRSGVVEEGVLNYNFHANFGPVTVVPTLAVYEGTTVNNELGSIVITSDEAGTNVLTGSDIYFGRTVYLHANVAEHYHLDNFVVDGQTTTDATVEATVGLTLNAALYVAIDRHSLTVNVDANGHGTVTGGGLYDYNTEHQISATADENYHFVEWNDHSTENPRTVTVTGNATYTASFAADVVTPTLAVYDEAGVNAQAGSIFFTATQNGEEALETITFGSNVWLNANFGAHYEFDYWMVNGAPVETYAQQVTVTNPMAVELHAKLQKHTVTVNYNNAMGTATGAGLYTYGTEATLSATAAEHYDFLGWYDGETQVSTLNPYTFTVENNTTITASFGLHQYTISTGTDVEGGHVDVTGEPTYGSTIELTAVPDAHRDFIEWSDGNTNNPRYVPVDGDAEYIPVFAWHRHTVNVVANNGNWGTVAVEGVENGTAAYGSHITVTATPSANYRLAYWLLNGEQVSTDLEYGFDILDTDAETVANDAAYNLTAVFELNQVQFTITSGDPEHGTVAGSGMYTIGATATISATVTATGWHFAGWSDGNNDNPRQIVVEEALTLTANFAINTYAVNITATEGGSISGLEGINEFTHGMTLTVTAVPAEGYHFTGWSDQVEDAERTITVTGDVTLVANFALNEYEVTAGAAEGQSNQGSVVIEGGENGYFHGITITLTAVPAEGYHFVQWSDGETDNPRTVVVTGDLDFTAEFAINMYTVTVNCDPTRGTVTGGGEYAYGSEATISATPAEHLHFVRWSDNNEEAERVIVVTSDTTLTAQFNYNVYTVTTEVAEGQGTVTGAGQYTYGTVAEVEAIPADGYSFVSWSDGSTVNPRSETVEGDVTYSAIFQSDSYDVTVVFDETEGTVTVEGEATHGSTIVLTATAEDHYHFVGWSDGNTENPRSIVVEGPINLEAIFAPDVYTLTVTSNDPLMGIVDGAGDYAYGAPVILTAIAAEHYHFVQWSDGNTDNPRTMTLESDLVLTANFAADVYTVTVTFDAQMGTIEGAGTYVYGSEVTLIATAAEGYAFEGWSVNGQVVSTNAQYTFTVEADITLAALFAEVDMVTITVNYNEAQGTVTGAGNHAVGSTVTLTAIPAEGYRFVRWSDGNTENPRIFIAETDLTLTAEFELVGINDVDMNEVTISSVDSKIVVRGAEGMSIYVFDVNGRVVNRVNNATDNTEFRMESTGVYLVKVGTAAAKRVVVVR